MFETIEGYIIVYAPVLVAIFTTIAAFCKIIFTIRKTLKDSVDENKEIKELVKEVLAENRDLLRQNRELKEKITHVKEPE